MVPWNVVVSVAVIVVVVTVGTILVVVVTLGVCRSCRDGLGRCCGCRQRDDVYASHGRVISNGFADRLCDCDSLSVSIVHGVRCAYRAVNKQVATQTDGTGNRSTSTCCGIGDGGLGNRCCCYRNGVRRSRCQRRSLSWGCRCSSGNLGGWHGLSLSKCNSDCNASPLSCGCRLSNGWDGRHVDSAGAGLCGVGVVRDGLCHRSHCLP